jgi:hypothetical protein
LDDKRRRMHDVAFGGASHHERYFPHKV